MGAKEKQKAQELRIINEKFQDAASSVLSERRETLKWKTRFNQEQEQHKKTQAEILITASANLDQQKREAAIQYDLENLQ